MDPLQEQAMADRAMSSECSALSAAIRYPSRYLDDLRRLEPEMFTSTRNQLVFKALATMEPHEVDIVSVKRRLIDQDRWQQVGIYWLGLLAGTSGWVPEMCPRHVATIRQDHIQREVAKLQRSATPDDTPDDVADRMATIQDLMADQNQEHRLLDGTGLADALTEELAVDEQSKLLLGWSVLDRHLGGIRPGELVTLLARPKVGKTMWAQSATYNILKQDRERPILWYSLEVPDAQWWIRWYQLSQRIPEATAIQQHQAGDLDEWRRWAPNLRVVAEGRPSVADIRADLRQHPSDLVVIDHTDFLRLEGEKTDNQADRVRQTFIALKVLAKQLKTRVLILHQGGRGQGNTEQSIFRMPVSRGSAGPEEASDAVLGIYRLKHQDKGERSANVPDPYQLPLVCQFSRRSAPFKTRLYIVPHFMLVCGRTDYTEITGESPPR